MLIPTISYSDNYSIYVRRVESNIYEDTRQDIIIKTSMCYVYSYGDHAILVGNGSGSGKIIFLDYDNKPKDECFVASVYKQIKF